MSETWPPLKLLPVVVWLWWGFMVVEVLASNARPVGAVVVISIALVLFASKHAPNGAVVARGAYFGLLALYIGKETWGYFSSTSVKDSVEVVGVVIQVAISLVGLAMIVMATPVSSPGVEETQARVVVEKPANASAGRVWQNASQAAAGAEPCDAGTIVNTSDIWGRATPSKDVQ